MQLMKVQQCRTNRTGIQQLSGTQGLEQVLDQASNRPKRHSGQRSNARSVDIHLSQRKPVVGRRMLLMFLSHSQTNPGPAGG